MNKLLRTVTHASKALSSRVDIPSQLPPGTCERPPYNPLLERFRRARHVLALACATLDRPSGSGRRRISEGGDSGEQDTG
eukprot:1050445-Pyramimonas_sp.AAC.1